MNDIRNRLTGKQQSKSFTEKDLIIAHHDMMCCYGWISVKEFGDMSIPTFFNLMEEVQQEKRKREEFRLTMLKFAGVKNPK